MLAERFPRAFIGANLLGIADYQPWPTVADRNDWEAIPEKLRGLVIEKAEGFLSFEWPTLPAVRFMDFARNGNRSRYEALNSLRRSTLGSLALAECMEGKGRFLDQIVNGIWCICEETSWIYPAHNHLSRNKEPLPDLYDPSVDLFAAETGAELCWVRYLLGSELDKVTPLITERIRREVETRILKPFMTEDIHWMGFSGRPNNWNPWCVSNCMISALLTVSDPQRRLDVIERSMTILDRWVNSYGPDGGCDEGASYWHVAGGCFFDCLEIILGVTGGKVSFYDEPLVAEIARYMPRMHISRDYFVNFADGRPRPGADGSLLYRYGKRIGDKDVMATGAYLFSISDVFPRSNRWYSFNRILPEVFGWDELTDIKAAAPYIRDAWIADVQVMTAREQAGSDRGLYLAAKGGHNCEHHNHNDVGSFIVFADGRPMLIDVGVGTYSRRTFSAERWSIWTMQSAYHNLPTVNGVIQNPGPQYVAKDVNYRSDDSLAEMSMDIADAYPAEAGIERWKRTCRLNRGGSPCVEITDDFGLTEPANDIALTLMVPSEPVVDGQCLILRDSEGSGVRIEFDRGLSCDVETIDIDDDRLSGAWGPRVYRVLLRAKEPTRCGTWLTRITML